MRRHAAATAAVLAGLLVAVTVAAEAAEPARVAVFPVELLDTSGEALRREMASPTIASVTTMVCLMCGAEQFFDEH